MMLMMKTSSHERLISMGIIIVHKKTNENHQLLNRDAGQVETILTKMTTSK
jgi:hypothetical protein